MSDTIKLDGTSFALPNLEFQGELKDGTHKPILGSFGLVPEPPENPDT